MYSVAKFTQLFFVVQVPLILGEVTITASVVEVIQAAVTWLSFLVHAWLTLRATIDLILNKLIVVMSTLLSSMMQDDCLLVGVDSKASLVLGPFLMSLHQFMFPKFPIRLMKLLVVNNIL